MSVSATQVKELRERTGAGMMDCKAALSEADGDIEKAIEILRVKGQASAAKRGDRSASEGTVASYIHSNGKIGVLVEVNCETDFVARNDDFLEFAREIAIHIAAANPGYVSDDDVAEEDKVAESELFAQQVDDSKPPEIQDKIIDGRVKKWLQEVVLLNQVHVNQDKYDGKTIEQLRTQISSKTGENVVIRRFARFEVSGD